MNAVKCWVVLRPVSKTKLVAKAAYFSKGAARNACVPNFDDHIKEAWLLLNAPEKVASFAANPYRLNVRLWGPESKYAACNLPSRKPAKKGVKRGKK